MLRVNNLGFQTLNKSQSNVNNKQQTQPLRPVSFGNRATNEAQQSIMRGIKKALASQFSQRVDAAETSAAKFAIGAENATKAQVRQADSMAYEAMLQALELTGKEDPAVALRAAKVGLPTNASLAQVVDAENALEARRLVDQMKLPEGDERSNAVKALLAGLHPSTSADEMAQTSVAPRGILKHEAGALPEDVIRQIDEGKIAATEGGIGNPFEGLGDTEDDFAGLVFGS